MNNKQIQKATAFYNNHKDHVGALEKLKAENEKMRNALKEAEKIIGKMTGDLEGIMKLPEGSAMKAYNMILSALRSSEE